MKLRLTPISDLAQTQRLLETERTVYAVTHHEIHRTNILMLRQSRKRVMRRLMHGFGTH